MEEVLTNFHGIGEVEVPLKVTSVRERVVWRFLLLFLQQFLEFVVAVGAVTVYDGGRAKRAEGVATVGHPPFFFLYNLTSPSIHTLCGDNINKILKYTFYETTHYHFAELEALASSAIVLCNPEKISPF